MRKFCCWVLVIGTILLMVSFSLAQSSRQPTSSEGKTGFTNVAIRGLDNDGSDAEAQPGLPGYIEMTSAKGDVFYLYIGYDGKLRIASEQAVGNEASPCIISWRDSSGVIVGRQNEIP